MRMGACQTTWHAAGTEKVGLSVEQARDFDFGAAAERVVDEEGCWPAQLNLPFGRKGILQLASVALDLLMHRRHQRLLEVLAGFNHVLQMQTRDPQPSG